jgi:hypothetical protein
MGGGGRRTGAERTHIYKNTALKKYVTQGLKEKAPKAFFPYL